MARRSSGWDGTYRRIDVHVHSRGWSRIEYRGSGSGYVRRIRRAGIDAICLLAPGETCKKAVEKFGRDFIIPVPMYRLRQLPATDIRSDMERWLDWGCKAIKFIAPLAPYSDERYWPLYEVLVDRGATAVFHTGYLAFSGPQPEVPPTRMTDMRAGHIDTVARRFPTLKILMSHFSNPWWEEAWKVSWSRPNIYADLSGLTATRRSLEMWAETFAPNGERMDDSLRKLCFASDVHYLFSGEHEFAPYVAFYERLLERLKVPRPIRRLIWAGNARKLFGLR